jgi:hypothetical protein
MSLTKTPRKRRTDRNHVIYELECTVTGERYIGLTVLDGTAESSVRGRFNRHISRARREGKDWLLCEALRKYGRDGFERKVLEVIRGKAEAHVRERELTKLNQPELNTL